MDWNRIQSRLLQLGFDPVMIDGIPGRLTRNAVRSFQFDRRLVVDGIVGRKTMAELFSDDDPQIADLDLPWFDEAQRLVGITEAPGAADNPAIMAMAEDLDIDYAGDDVAWCGLFVAHCIASTLSEEPLPNRPLGARQWQRFGTKLPDLVRGAVVVFWRGSPTDWRGHVGFCTAADGTHVHCLGGNQSNAVNVRRIPRSRLLAIRWPATSSAPRDVSLSSAALSVPTTDGNEE